MSTCKPCDAYSSLPCEQKCAIQLLAINIAYFLLSTVFEVNILSFAFTKALGLLAIGVIKYQFFDKKDT